MRTSEWFIVIDTETADSVKRPLPYDIGYKIVNRKGEITVERSFVVYEIFVGQKEMMKSAYYADKIPQYEKDLKQGGRKLVRLYTARKQILDDMENYKISVVYAYNVGFDHRALNNDQAFTTNNRYRYFFPYGTEFRCIWNMACQVLLARPSYIKYAKENNFISEKGNILTNAECCYRYLTRNPNFKEEHKGLEDVSIEIEILLACYKQHKKMETKPYTACWRLVQKKREEMEAARLGAAFSPGPKKIFQKPIDKYDTMRYNNDTNQEKGDKKMIIRQVKFRPEGEDEYFGGIYVQSHELEDGFIICGCCGGVYEIEDIVKEDIQIYGNWVDISEEIIGS